MQDSVSCKRSVVIGKAAIAVFCVVVSDTVASETWLGVASSGYAAVVADLDSVHSVAAPSHTVGVWFRYTYPTSVDCSPPRGCYAASQRIYYHVNCHLVAYVPVQKVSMDLNGNTVAKIDYAGWPSVPLNGVLESQAMRNFCEDYLLRSLNPSPSPWATQPTPWPRN